MINGKFFAGLPPKMIDRQSGPNRQQSNLFWPDESDIESAPECKSKRRQKIAQQTSVDSNSPSNTDVDTKELFRKQLSSKIEFYDVMDDPVNTSNLKTSTLQSTALETTARRNKIEAFTSKVEFYDYANDININIPKTDKNSKKDVERNSKNSPKTIDKRIKFIEKVDTDFETTKPKGILRNNEKSSKDKSDQDQSRKRLVKKRNLSKSVENLSSRSPDFSDDDDDCIKVIENDVKNITISDNKIQEKAGKQSPRKEEFPNYLTGRSNIKVDRPQTPINHDQFDDKFDSPEEQIDENFYRKSSRDQAVVYHEVRRYPHDDHMDSDRGSQLSISRQQSQSKNKNLARSEKTTNSQRSLDRSQQPSLPPPDQQQQSPNSRSHRHLVSSISFGNDTEPATDRPPKSVRSSAVARVSVGLPD